MTRYSPLAVLLVSLGLAACGGDDDSGSAPTKAQFANNAEKICQDTEKEIENIGNGAESPDDVAAAIDKVIDETQKAADDLVALERPEGQNGEKAHGQTLLGRGSTAAEAAFRTRRSVSATGGKTIPNASALSAGAWRTTLRKRISSRLASEWWRG